MRSKMGMLVMEDASGEIAVQVFEDPDSAARSFAELKGRPGEPPRRATWVVFQYGAGGVKVDATARDLPVPPTEAEDGHVVGEGPRRGP